MQIHKTVPTSFLISSHPPQQMRPQGTWACSWRRGLISQIKKKTKFSSYIRKFRWQRLQSHIWGRPSFWISSYMRNIQFNFLSEYLTVIYAKYAGQARLDFCTQKRRSPMCAVLVATAAHTCRTVGRTMRTCPPLRQAYTLGLQVEKRSSARSSPATAARASPVRSSPVSPSPETFLHT